MADEAHETRVAVPQATRTGTADGTPLYFGPAAAPRSGWWHGPTPEAAAARPDGPVVVLCAPFGYEAVCIHRFQRTLARTLALAGLPVLRFAWHGTGDSDGFDHDPARVPTWLDDVALAVDEARRGSGRHEVVLIGTRLGATLAAEGAARAGGVDTLVLLAPYAAGRAFVREARAFRTLAEKDLGGAPPGARTRAEGDEEAAGFLIGAETLVALAGLDLGALRQAPARRAIIIPRDDLPGPDEKLRQQLTALGVATEVRAVPGYAALMQDPHKSVTPAEIVSAIATLLDVDVNAAESAAPAPPLVAPDAPRAHARVRSGQRDFRVEEQPLALGSDGRIFAIATRPSATTTTARPVHEPVIVWLNAGAIDHNGPNRLYTRFSRAWAAHGITSVRVDLPGLGDSPARAGSRDNRLYTSDTVPDVRRILTSLETELGVRHFVLAGLCAGAYAAWHAGRSDTRVVGEILINPQTFHFAEGDPLDIGARVNYREAQHYRERFFRLEAWRKLLVGRVDLRHIAGVAGRRARDVAATRLKRVLLRLGRGDPRTLDLLAGFRETEARGMRTLLVFSATDPGLDYLTSHLGPGLRLLGERSHLRLDIVHGADHTFTPLWSQEVLHDLLDAYVRRELGAVG